MGWDIKLQIPCFCPYVPMYRNHRVSLVESHYTGFIIWLIVFLVHQGMERNLKEILTHHEYTAEKQNPLLSTIKLLRITSHSLVQEYFKL